ncbi:MAG: hypothetical protein R3E52_03275 [Burkholderiaceae bacterium]
MALAQRMGMSDDMFGGDISWNYQLGQFGRNGQLTFDVTPRGLKFRSRPPAVSTPAGRPMVLLLDSRRRAGASSCIPEALLEIGQPALPTFIEPAENPHPVQLISPLFLRRPRLAGLCTHLIGTWRHCAASRLG